MTFDIWVMAMILVRGVIAAITSLGRDHPVVVAIDPLQHGALPLAQEMPGYDVGVMLQDRQDDLVALADMIAAVARGDEVDRLGRGLCEDDLLQDFGIEERAHALARRLEIVCRRIGKVVQAAMDVGVFKVRRFDHTLDDRLRLLRGSTVVEIDQRLAVGLERQGREVGPDLLDIEGGVVRVVGHGASVSPYPTCGRWPSRQRGSNKGVEPLAERPSSITASRRHLLPSRRRR